jgi:hypothetical protein
MTSSRLNLLAASALLLTAGVFGHAPEAHAGDVTNAQLACFVDTYAYDQLTTGYCASAWTPNTANNPTTAYFEVVGLPAGSYTYTWTDVTTGQTNVCPSTNKVCTRSIRIVAGRDGVKDMRVTVRDNATGATRTVTATAEFIDAYH